MSILGDVLWLTFASVFGTGKKISSMVPRNKMSPIEAFRQYERGKYISKGIYPSLNLQRESSIRDSIEYELYKLNGIYPKRDDAQVIKKVAARCRKEGFLCLAEWNVHQANYNKATMVYPNNYIRFDQ